MTESIISPIVVFIIIEFVLKSTKENYSTASLEMVSSILGTSLP